MQGWCKFTRPYLRHVHRPPPLMRNDADCAATPAPASPLGLTYLGTRLCWKHVVLLAALSQGPPA